MKLKRFKKESRPIAHVARSVTQCLDILVPFQDISSSELADTLASSICTPMDPIDVLLSTCFFERIPRAAPIHYLEEGDISGAVWHHGEGYVTALKGAPEQLLLRCSLSQTDREKALLDATKRARHTFEVTACARAFTKQNVQSIGSLREIEFVGFIITKPIIR